MTGPTHTPLPWTLHGNHYINARIRAGDTDIAMLADNGKSIENGMANADFIVHACNSHYQLLAVLEVAVACTAPSTAWVKEARAIIAKARGKE